MKRSNSHRIDELIAQVLHETKLDIKLKEYELIKSWETVIGKNIAQATTDIYIRNRKLYVKIASSVIRNELIIIRQGLIKALNAKVEMNVIDDIVIR